MLTSHSVQGATENRRALLRVFHLVQDESIRLENGRLWGSVWGPACIFAGAILLLTTSGRCIATRSWVQDQLNPIKGQLNDTNAKADSALAGLQNLQLERRLVLDSRHGPTFAFGLAALTENAKREIDGFLQDLERSTGRRRDASSLLPGIQTASARRSTTTSSDSGEPMGLPDTWSARKASTRRKCGWSPTERANR
jgi:hypothetical protein